MLSGTGGGLAATGGTGSGGVTSGAGGATPPPTATFSIESDLYHESVPSLASVQVCLQSSDASVPPPPVTRGAHAAAFS